MTPQSSDRVRMGSRPDRRYALPAVTWSISGRCSADARAPPAYSHSVRGPVRSAAKCLLSAPATASRMQCPSAKLNAVGSSLKRHLRRGHGLGVPLRCRFRGAC